MEKTVRHTLAQWLSTEERVILGLSGGADSVALAHLMHDLGYKMEIVHINFHLRGKESDQDEVFVTRLHEQFFRKHRLHKFDVDTITHAKKKGISIEMAAREIRYSIFHDLAKEKGIKWILVGHHADDQIETALLNLARGTGGKGMAGMKVCNEQNILRPLLKVWRRDIIGYLNSHGYKYCNDSTNAETQYKRNMIRHKVIPLLERINPSFKPTMLRSMDIFREEQETLDHMADKYFHKIYSTKAQVIDFSQVQNDQQSHLLLGRRLRTMQFSQNQIDNILKYNQNVKCTTYSSNDGYTHIQIYRGLGFIFSDETVPIPHPKRIRAGWNDLEGLGSLSIGGFEGTLRVNSNILSGGNIILRSAEKSDRFQPYGMKKGSKKLFRYLGEKGIPEYYRERWPILCNHDDVIAVLPFEVSEKARTHDNQPTINLTFYPSDGIFGEIMKLFYK